MSYEEENMQSDYVTKFKELSNGTQRAILTLGVLTTNGMSTQFYTAADVTERMVKDVGLGFCTDKDFFKLSSLVSVLLAQVLRSGNKSQVVRSNVKITPIYCTRPNVKSSYGFRIGMPLKTKSREDFREAKQLTENPVVGADIFEVINNTNNYQQLMRIQEALNKRSAELFEEYKHEVLKMSDKMIKFKDMIKDLKEL